jgi:hypothetical protein
MQWLLIALMAWDLASVKSEPNLEKRSDLALEYASQSLDRAREAYAAGDVPSGQTALEEVRESVEVAYQSLQDTGKDARRSPKFFKRAELKTRELLRRLEGVKQTLSFDDRPVIEKVRARVNEVHDDLLTGLMSKKK